MGKAKQVTPVWYKINSPSSYSVFCTTVISSFPIFIRVRIDIWTERPHAALWTKHQVHPLKTLNPKMFSLWSFTAKWVDGICFSPVTHKLTFAFWQIALAPFTPVTLTHCCPGCIPSFSASCCVSIEICAPVSIRNFVNGCQGPTGIKMYGWLLCIHW